MYTPNPKAAIYTNVAKTWNAAWNQTTPGKEARRMAMAPAGNKMTNARAARTPCAMSIARCEEGPPEPEPMDVNSLDPEFTSSQ